MALAILHWKMGRAERRFVVWMAIGTAFVLALVAADFLGATPIP
jgi:hypothetical protein